MSKKAKKHWMKNVAGALVIPVFAAVLLQGICMANGRTMIVNMVSFDNFMVYTAIVMITTIALSVNLNSGRFDFSLGSMAILSSVLGAKISYGILGGGSWKRTAHADTDHNFWNAAWAVIWIIVYCVTLASNHHISWGVTLIYEGIIFTITEGRYVMKEVQNASMTAFTGNWIYAAIIIAAVLVICIVIFDYTKFGYDYNALKNGRKLP